MDFPLYSKITFLVAYMILCIGLIIRLGTKDQGTRAFVLMIWAAGTWVLSRGVFHGAVDPFIATQINKVSFLIGNIIGVLLFRFAYMFPDNNRLPEYLHTLLVLSVSLLVPFYMQESIAVGPVFSVEGIQRWGWEQGPWLLLHDIHFVGLTALSVFLLYWKTRKYSKRFRRNFFITLIVVIIGFAPPIIATNILPRFFNVFQYDWISSLSMLVWIAAVTYAMVRYNHMNTKTVGTELLIFAATGILFINIFI